MKKICFLLTALLLFSCQNEENTINQNNDAALTKSSPLASLVLRVSQNPTHADNILDGSDCYSVQLPVTITLNGQTMSIENENDFDAIAVNRNASNSDDDIIHFQFPIVVVMPDFMHQAVANQQQLDAISCQDNGLYEISCLDIVFPISISIYNTNNQVADTVTITGDAELYNFIDGLSTSDIFTIVYPVTITFGGGGQTTVGNNNELENAIEQVIADCNTSPGQNNLETIMTAGTWYISYCEDDSSGSGSGGQIYLYDGYVFTFGANGNVTAVKNNVTSNGTWDNYQDSHQMLDLFFPAQALQGLTNDEWRVIEYNQTTFRLKNDQSGGDGGHEYLYFTKI